MTLTPGDIVPVNVSPGRQRVLVALNWDARQQRAGLMERLKGIGGHNVETHDLDISCVMYSQMGEFLDGVSGRPEEMADQSGKVYHSGDDTTGTGEYDDESISIELGDLPADIHHIILVVEVQSKHTFDNVDDPCVRIADAKSGTILQETHIKGPHSAFIYGRLYRDGSEGWKFHYIGEYKQGAQIADWVEELKRFAR